MIEIAFEENIIEDRAHVVKASLETVRQLGQGELTVVWLFLREMITGHCFGMESIGTRCVGKV